MQICEINSCYGCMACYNICPNNSISIGKVNGFAYPVINDQTCINCGLCRKVCQVNSKPVIKSFPEKKVIAGAYKDKAALKESSSGAVAYALAKKILSDGGIAYGASFTEKLELKHVGVCRVEDIPSLQKSKYLQSDLNNTYSNIKERLNSGSEILFVGTPCQVGGLYAFLGGDNKKLITVDLLCSGVPSQSMFTQYINLLTETHKKRVISIDFRDKSHGWGNNYTKIMFDDGSSLLEPSDNNPWYKLFIAHWALRESCYKCAYACEKRIADITIGDYWGIEKYLSPDKYLDGVSKIIVNTEKGEKAWGRIKEEFISYKMPWESAIRPNLISPAKRPPMRSVAFKITEKRGLLYLFNLNMNKSVTWRIRKKIINQMTEYLYK